MRNTSLNSTIGRLFLLTSVFASLCVLSKEPGKAQKSPQGNQSVKVEAVQLDQIGSNVPVELKCGSSVPLKAPNELDGLTCIIKNNTTKRIKAGSVSVIFELEQEGRKEGVSSYDTFDTFLHPDFREDRRDNLIRPGGEYPLRQLPASFDNALIRGIRLQIDFIEFEDNTSVGPNRKGSQIIADVRSGAAKAKTWLVRKFNESGKSIEPVVPLLAVNQSLPLDELGIANESEQSGARLYLGYALRTYREKGAEALTRHLNKP